MLRPFARVVAQSLKPIKRLAACKRTQQLPTLMAQQCWELLRPFAHSFINKVRSYERESTFFGGGLIPGGGVLPYITYTGMCRPTGS